MNEDKTLHESCTELQLSWNRLIQEIVEMTKLDNFVGWISKKLGE